MAELGEGLSGYLDVQDATLRAPRIEAVSNIGISNTAPQHAFSVGSNLYVSTDSSNVITVDGNVVCEGVKVGLIEIIPSYDFAAVSNVGNVTQSTIQFANATTGFTTTANIEVGTANLFVDTTTGRVGIGVTEPVSGLTVSKDIESSNSFITERVLFKETWPNGHNSLAGDLGTWVVTNLNLQSNPSSTTTPDGYTHVSFNGVPAANGEFVSPAFDLSDYAIVDGTLQADDKRKTTTRVFMKCWFGTRQLDAGNEVAQVQFSPDDGSTWYTVATSQDRNNTDRFTMVSADLSPYILETSTNAKIRFYMPWNVAGGDYMRIGRIWIHESDVPTNLGGMWLGAGGNIGIGTTNPQDVTHIWKNGANDDHGLLIEQNNAGTGSATLKFGVAHTTESTAGLSKAGIFFKRGNTNGRGDLLFCMDNADDTNDVDTSNHALTIYRDGNVGIGTVSPVGPLDVFGGSASSDSLMYVRNTANANTDRGAGIVFENRADNGTRFSLGHILALRENSVGSYSSYLRFSPTANGSPFEAMRITNGGNVGIGTASPAQTLHVNGKIKANSLGLGQSGNLSRYSKKVGRNNGNVSFTFDIPNTNNWQPGYFIIRAALNNANSGSAYGWSYGASFRTYLDASYDLISTIEGANPGATFFETSRSGGVITITALAAGRNFVTATCELLSYPGIEND